MNHSLGSCLKTVIDFSHFSLDSGMFSKETEGNVHMYERIYRFLSRWIRKKEKYANSKWVLRNRFCWRSNVSNNEKISLTLISSPNDVWETSAEISWRLYPDLGSSSDWLNQISHSVQPIRITTQIWVVTQWRVISMNFFARFFRRHFAGKTEVASWNVGCFLRLV